MFRIFVRLHETRLLSGHEVMWGFEERLRCASDGCGGVGRAVRPLCVHSGRRPSRLRDGATRRRSRFEEAKRRFGWARECFDGFAAPVLIAQESSGEIYDGYLGMRADKLLRLNGRAGAPRASRQASAGSGVRPGPPAVSHRVCAAPPSTAQ